VFGLVRGNDAGWASIQSAGAIAAGLLLGVAFVAREKRTAAPMLPLRLFGSRAFSSGTAATFLLTASLFGAVYLMAQFLQIAKGDGPLEAGLHLLPWTATLFFVAPVAGRWIERLGERPFVVGGLLLQAAGMVALAAIVSPDTPYGELVAPLVLAGAGVSMAIPAAQSAVVSHVAPADIGRASGALMTMRQLGAAFGVALLVAVFLGGGGYASPQAFGTGFAHAMAVSAVLSLAGAVAGLASPRTAAWPRPWPPRLRRAPRTPSAPPSSP
jgi:MFS family permease